MKRAIVVLLLLIANAVFGTSKETTIPATAPGRLLQEWLTAFNAADEAGLRKFADKRYTEQARGGRLAGEIVEGQLESRQSNGCFDLFKVEHSTPTDLTVALKSRGTFPRFVRLALKVDARAPELLSERRASAMTMPANSGEERKEPAHLAEELDRKLEELTKQDRFSGTALIAKDGKPVWQKAYGLQDREQSVPVNLDTRFRLGSMNKMFTSVAVAQLVERGKFKFEDRLASVLPDYPNKEIAGKVTVHHLLTHTSGLGDIFTSEFWQKKDELRELADYLQLFVEKPLRFEPGNGWSYSNAGFIVLGLIIEKHSGQNYYDYIQRHIYDVAGMSSSSSLPRSERLPNIAVGYMRASSGEWTTNWSTMPYRGMSAGGGESTVGDLLRFANALRGYKLLSPEMTELITSGKPGTEPGSPSQYAYGFSDRHAGQRRIVGHNGGAPGMNADLSILWNDGYTVAVLANVDPTVAQDAAQFAADRLL